MSRGPARRRGGRRHRFPSEVIVPLAYEPAVDFELRARGRVALPDPELERLALVRTEIRLEDDFVRRLVAVRVDELRKHRWFPRASTMRMFLASSRGTALASSAIASAMVSFARDTPRGFLSVTAMASAGSFAEPASVLVACVDAPLYGWGRLAGDRDPQAASSMTVSASAAACEVFIIWFVGVSQTLRTRQKKVSETA